MKLRSMKAVKQAGIALVCASVLSANGCGYLMYPERVGQTDGRVDPAIFVLDAIGLFIGVIPGVVAFAVDFSTGAIYLSPGEKSVIDKHKGRLSSEVKLKEWNTDDWVSINGLDLPGDTAQVAATLSVMLDRKIDVKEIQFYKVQQSRSLVMIDSGYRVH